jgi:hypothetical protein
MIADPARKTSGSPNKIRCLDFLLRETQNLLFAKPLETHLAVGRAILLQEFNTSGIMRWRLKASEQTPQT